MSREHAVGVRIGDEAIGEVVPAATVAARREIARPINAFSRRCRSAVPAVTGSQLDPESLGRPRFEVPGLNDPEQPRSTTRRHMRRQRLEGHARVRELAP